MYRLGIQLRIVDSFQAYRRSLVDQTAEQLIEENLEAFQELAK